MRMTDSIHWIACGYVGPWFTAAGDCNVYLLHGPRGYLMIDAGCGDQPELIEQQLAWSGIAPGEIKAILLTHPHSDHAAGAVYWRQRCNARLLAPAACAAYLRRGGPYVPGNPGHSVIPPCPVDQELVDRESFEAAGLSLQAFATPGHCPSMMMYLVRIDGRDLLVTGDAFYWGGKLTIFVMPDSSLPVFKQTLLGLREIGFEAILPGHRYPVLSKAKEHLELALQEADRQLSGQPPMRG